MNYTKGSVRKTLDIALVNNNKFIKVSGRIKKDETNTQEMDSKMLKFAEKFKEELIAGDTLFFYDEQKARFRISWLEDSFYLDFAEANEKYFFEKIKNGYSEKHQKVFDFWNGYIENHHFRIEKTPEQLFAFLLFEPYYDKNITDIAGNPFLSTRNLKLHYCADENFLKDEIEPRYRQLDYTNSIAMKGEEVPIELLPEEFRRLDF